jgi:hypothetical protein
MSDTTTLADALRRQFNGEDRSTVDHIIHMPGTEPMRSASEIKLHLVLDHHMFRAIIPNPDRDIDQLIAGWNELLAVAKKLHPNECRVDDRDTTKDMLRDMLIEDRHFDAPGQSANGPALMAAGIAWMIFGPTNPIAEIVRLRRPSEAGYEITKQGPGYYNWRQMII